MALDFSLSPEQELIKTSARAMMHKFAGRADEFKQMILKEKRFPAEIWRAFADAGLLGAVIPEEYGGTDAGLLSVALAAEEIGKHGFGSALFIVTVMDTACIVRNGSEELKKRVLPRIASGDLTLCFALTEPDAGSNTFRLETFAKKDGAGYRLNGQKVFITGADHADLMLVVARTKSREDTVKEGFPKMYGRSLFLVDPKAKGIAMQPLPMHGIEGARQFHIFFDDVAVGAEDMVGFPHAGTMALFNSLNPERILAAANAVGCTEYLIERSVAYAKERKVFHDTPIGAHQAVAHPLAELKIELEACRLSTRHAAWAFDQNLSPLEDGFLSNAAKYKAAEMWIAAADRAIQTHGGYGFSEDYGIIHHWASSRLVRTAPISKEMILNYVAEHTLQLPRSY